MLYYVYILQCADGTFYTGVTTDIERRLHEHNHSLRGAKYTRSRRPVAFVYSKKFRTHSRALREEIRIKSLSRKKKLYLIQNKNT